MKLQRELNKAFILFLLAVGIIVLFSAADFFIHKLSKEYAVPQRYFTNKMIFGTIIGFAALWIAKKQKLLIKSLVFSSAVSILLQVRYFIEGYPLDFVLLFLAIHFMILMALSLTVFKLVEIYKKKGFGFGVFKK